MSQQRFIHDPTAPDGVPVNPVPKLKAVRPFGSTLLVEHLSTQDILGTVIKVRDSAKLDGAPQAYVVELGPKVDPEAGVKVGDRVIIQGNYVPVPKLPGETRARGIIELHNIKARLEELTEESPGDEE